LRSSGEGRDGDKLNLLIVFHWIVTVFSLFYSLVSWWINFHPGMIIMAANAVLLLLNLAYLKHSGRFQLATPHVLADELPGSGAGKHLVFRRLVFARGVVVRAGTHGRHSAVGL